MGGEFSNWSSHIGDLKYNKKLSIKEYVIKSKSKLIFLLMVIILGVIISSITPYLYGKIIDYIVKGDLKSIKNFLFCFATFNIVSIALSILENVIGTQITIGISNNIKYKIFSHILHLKANEQDRYSTGELLNRTEGDADAIVSYYINVITSWIMIIINLTVSIYFLIKISKMLTEIGILLLPVNYLINFLFRNRIKIYKLKEKQKEDGYFKFVNIALSNLKNIKVLLLEKFFSHKFLEIKDEQYKIEIKNVYLSSLINFLQQLFNQIFEVIIIFISAVFIIKGILSIGMMVSFNSYLEKLFDAISRLISLNLEKQTLAISLERINDIQSKEKEIVAENQPIKINKIEFSHVSFKYDKNEVLRVLKPNGTFIVNQNGSDNLKEFLSMYMPFKMKGVWDMNSCAMTLANAGFEVVETKEDRGYIRFHNLRQIQTYFRKVAPEVAENVAQYKSFYMNALDQIKQNTYFQLTTYRFLVVAKKNF